MRPLLTLSARFCGVSGAMVLAVGLAAGAIRLLPWLVAPDVPLRLAAPFARTLMLGATEMAVLVSLPLGVAIATAVFVERGEARALAALGASPQRFAAGLAWPGLALVALYVLLSSSTTSESPGRLAARLIAEGRASCAETAGPRRVDVPLVALAWLCFREGPKLAGRLPGVARDVWFSAADVQPDADLRTLSAQSLSLAARLETHAVQLRVDEAHVVGLRGWGRPKVMAGALRAAVIGASALATALVAVLIVLRRGRPGPVAAGALSGVAGASMALVLSRLDSREAPLLLYAALPAVGVAVLVSAYGLFGWIAERLVAGRNPQ